MFVFIYDYFIVLFFGNGIVELRDLFFNFNILIFLLNYIFEICINLNVYLFCIFVNFGN